MATNAACLALLLDRNTTAGRELARQAYNKVPNDAAATVTYAFTPYGTGRTADGIAILPARVTPACPLRSVLNSA